MGNDVFFYKTVGFTVKGGVMQNKGKGVVLMHDSKENNL